MKLKLKQNNIVIKADYLVIFGLVILLLRPDGISHFSPFIATFIWNWLTLLAGLICILLFVIHYVNTKYISFISFTIFAFTMVALILTIVKGTSIGTWYMEYSNAIFMCCLFESYREKLPILLKCMLFYLEILLYINLICMILFPNGMYYSETTGYFLNWFLGYKSSLQYYIIPALAFSWINAHYTGEKMRFLILNIVCIIETIISQNMMLLVIEILLEIVYLFRLYNRPFLCNSLVYSIIGNVFDMIMVFFTTILTSSTWGIYFLNLLNKSGTLGGRTTKIWPNAIKFITKKLLSGYGVLSADIHTKILGMNAAIHCHNQILEVLLCGGIILLILYIMIIIALTKELMTWKELMSSKVLGIYFFAILLTLSVEVFTRRCGTGIWLLLLMAGNSKELDAQFNLSPKKGKRKKVIWSFR